MANSQQDTKDYQDYLDYQKYQQTSVKPGPNATTGDKLNAFDQGAANVYTLGQLPKLQAAVQKYLPDPDKSVNDTLSAQGIKITEPGYNDYDTALQQYQNYRNQQASDLPDAYYGGEGAAALTSAVPGGLMAGRGLLRAGKAAYEFSNSPPAQVMGKIAIPVGAYLLGKRKSGGGE